MQIQKPKKPFRNKHNSQSGFTLMELLVVISIIGFIASMLAVVFNDARMQSRDLKRVADLKQLQKAIETYNIDQSQYPQCYSGPAAQICGSPPGFTVAGNQFPLSNLDIVAKGYVQNTPDDPINQLNNYGYYYLRGYKKTGNCSCTGCSVPGGSNGPLAGLVCKTNSAKDYMLATFLENPANVSYPEASTTSHAIPTGGSNLIFDYLIGNLD